MKDFVHNEFDPVQEFTSIKVLPDRVQASEGAKQIQDDKIKWIN